MVDTQTLTDIRTAEKTLIDSLSKLFGAGIGLLYLTGLVVVAGHLSRYGIPSFSFIQLQYLIAGGWALFPPVALSSVIPIARRFELRAAPDLPGKSFSWRRFLIAIFLGGIPFAACMILLGIVLTGITFGIGVRLYLFCLVLATCAQIFWRSWRSQEGKETPMLNRSHAGPFYLLLLLTIALIYVVWFSVRVYPLIPFSLGGGKPLTVVFIAGEKRLPDGIVNDISSPRRSVPYKLLTMTEKSYVVLSPEHNEESIEFAKDSVQGMVVLKEPHVP